MVTSIVIHIIVAFVLVLVGAVIAAGKGDWLIAGYNTASKEKKSKYNIKRLRLCISMIAFVEGFITLLAGASVKWPYTGVVYTVLTLVVVAVGLYYVHFWAKKK